MLYIHFITELAVNNFGTSCRRISFRDNIYYHQLFVILGTNGRSQSEILGFLLSKLKFTRQQQLTKITSEQNNFSRNMTQCISELPATTNIFSNYLTLIKRNNNNVRH